MREIKLTLLIFIIASLISIIFLIPPMCANQAKVSVSYDDLYDREMEIFDSYFIQNMGQMDSGEILFYSRGGNIFFTPDGVLYRFSEMEPIDIDKSDLDPIGGHIKQSPSEYHEWGVVLKYSFIGSNNVIPEGRDQCTWNTNYFKGSDPEKWYTEVPNYKEIVYPELWDGIDLVYRLKEGSIKYDLIIHPGADPSDIRIRIDGANGLSINLQRDLVIGTEYWDIIDSGLISYYGDGSGGSIPCRFELMNDCEFKISLGAFDRSRNVVIDPLINYSTFIGGSGADVGNDIAIDISGNAYITGYTDDGTTDYPTTTGAFDTMHNGFTDVFVTKLNPDGSSLVYSTFIGGSYKDDGWGIVIDTSGNAYITGYTKDGTTDYPTTSGAFDTTHNGESDVFVTKLNPSGSSLVYSTFLGGSETDSGEDIAIDTSGNAYITGVSDGNDYPTTSGAFDRTHNGGYDVFVTKLNPSGSSLVYSTFLGGSETDSGEDIAIDTSGNAYITGVSDGNDYPTTSGAFDRTHNGGYDVFVTKLNPSGSSLVYSTFLGGSGVDTARDIAVDSSGNAYITGGSGANYPTTSGAFDTTYNGDTDVFVTKLNPAGSSLVYSTFIGSLAMDGGLGIVIDTSGNAYITGVSDGNDYPTTFGAYDTTFNGGLDVFVSMLNPAGSSLEYSTFIGGSTFEYVNSIAIDTSRNTYIIGRSDVTTDYPTTSGAFNPIHNGTTEVFVTKMNFDIDITPPVFSSDNCDRNATTGEQFKFEVVVSDNIELSVVYVKFRFGDGSFTNSIMSGFGSFKYSITIPYRSIDSLHYLFQAVDNSGNTAETSEKTITVVDNDRPEFGSDFTPTMGTTGESLSFSISVFDNIDGSSVFVDYRLGLDMNINASMSGPNIFNHSIEIPQNFSGEIYYHFSSVDNSDNWNSTSQKTILILDGVPPTFINDLTPDQIGTGEILEFMVEVSDNIEVSSVTVEYWIGSGDKVNESMSKSDIFTYSITIPSNSTDTIWYIFHASDPENNWRSIQGSVVVFDTLPPHAEFVIDSRIEEDKEVLLDGSGSYDNIEISDWIWKIAGDSQQKIFHGKIANHIFSDPGNYTIGLKVLDLAGNWDIKVMEISIIDITPPIADAGEDCFIPEGFNLIFDSSESWDNVGIVDWSWIFIDEVVIVLQGPSPNYTFMNPGVFEITLTVNDGDGNFGMDNMTVNVRDITPPIANAGRDQTLLMGSIGILNGSVSKDNVGIVNWTWSFNITNEAVILYGKTVEFNFTIPGNYTVSLIVKDREDNTGSDTTVINVTMIKQDDSEKENGRSLYNYWWTIIVILGLVSCIWIIITIRKKNQKNNISISYPSEIEK